MPAAVLALLGVAAIAAGAFALCRPAGTGDKEDGKHGEPSKTAEQAIVRLPQETTGAWSESGTELVLELDRSLAPDVDLDLALEHTTEILERRALVFGLEPGFDVERDNDDRLIVRVPGLDSSKAMKMVRTGLLRFRELQYDEHGNVGIHRNGQLVFVPLPNPVPGKNESAYTLYRSTLTNAVWVPSRAIGSDGLEKELTGHYLTDAFPGSDAAGLPTLDFRFNSEGAHLLQQITTRLQDQPLALFLDGEPIQGADGDILAPVVREVIADRFRITGLALEDADYLVKLRRAGALPVPMKIVESRAYGP